MGLKKYFDRSYTKLQGSSFYFSSTLSFSSSTSSADEDATATADDIDNEPSFDADSTSTSFRRRKRPSWLKRSSSFAIPTMGKNNNPKNQSKHKDRSKDRSSANGNASNNSHGDAGTDDPQDQQQRQQPNETPPPLSPQASSELQEAVSYFGIIARDDLTREAVKKKYKRLSLIHHPDRNNNSEKAIHEMQMINHYFDLLEEELDRLEEETKHNEDDDPPTSSFASKNSSSSNTNTNGETDTDNGNHARSNKHPSRRQSRSGRRRSSFNSNAAPDHPATEDSSPSSSPQDHGEQQQPKKPQRRRRRNSTERRQRKTQHKQERQKMEREMKQEWDDNAQKTNDFLYGQRKVQKQNQRRSAQEQLETKKGRDRAFDAYTRDVQAYRDEIERTMNNNSNTNKNERAEGSPVQKPRHALMDCCSEDAVVAMRLGQTAIAIELIHQEIHNATEEWILLKMRTSYSANAGRGVYESASNRGISVPLDRSYYARILEVLVRPLDGDKNTILHYAVYTEDYEMISYLAQVSRQYKSFARFVAYPNDRNLAACDCIAGCTWDNATIIDLMMKLSDEALILLREKEQRRRLASRKRKEERQLREKRVFVDPLFDLVLCFLVGKYVTRSGWVASPVIIALAYLAEAGNRKCFSVLADSGPGASSKSSSSSYARTRIPKALFFTLHAAWYLLTGILLKCMDVLATISDKIPLPWQLQLVGLLTVPFFVKLRHWPLRYMARAAIRIESIWIVGLDWILSKNHATFSFSSSYIRDIVDFVLLSIPFFAVELCRKLG